MSATILAWSGGKDPALARWVLREELGIEPAALMTRLTEGDGRVGMHAVRRELAARGGFVFTELSLGGRRGGERRSGSLLADGY